MYFYKAPKITNAPKHFVFIACAFLLVSCENSKPQEYIAVGHHGINFTDKEITDFYINDKKIAFSSMPYGGGSGTSCCVKIHKVWTPGLTAHIKWTNAEALKGQGGETIWKEKDVPLPQYGENYSGITVVFLDNDEVVLDMSGGVLEINKLPRRSEPKGWRLPTGHQRYCEGIKLTNETPRQCFERLVQRDKDNQDGRYEYPEYKWIDNPKK